jgi:membrane dipeptidase
LLKQLLAGAYLAFGFVQFVSEGGEHGHRANVSLMADHVDYLGRLAGRRHVGVGSDLDGIAKTPEGLEDASKYPNLVAELIRRGWSDKEIAGFASENLLRVLAKAEKVAYALQRQGTPVQTDVFEGREDIGDRAKHPW